jgi:hypothetical protein
MSELPDKMTGKDLITQETHEMDFERKIFNNRDRVDRRDKQNHIVSMVSTDCYRKNYDLIKWS